MGRFAEFLAILSLCAGIGFVLVASLLASVFVVHEECATAQTEHISEVVESRLGNESSEESDILFDYGLDSKREMPCVEIDGVSIVGRLQIDSLGIDLGVADAWSDGNADKVPCRYSGSVYSNDLILAGHNWRSHFGNLYDADIGDNVVFTGVDNNRFYYRVSKIETVSETDVGVLNSGDWDLTLFTCTLDGRDRLVIRCSETKDKV